MAQNRTEGLVIVANIKGFGFISEKKTWHEALEEALEAYREKYGRDPGVAHIDARLWPEGLKKIGGIYPLKQCQEGMVILEH